MSRKGKHIKTESTLVAGGDRRRKWGVTVNRYRVSFE